MVQINNYGSKQLLTGSRSKYQICWAGWRAIVMSADSVHRVWEGFTVELYLLVVCGVLCDSGQNGVGCQGFAVSRSFCAFRIQ